MKSRLLRSLEFVKGFCEKHDTCLECKLHDELKHCKIRDAIPCEWDTEDIDDVKRKK